MPDTQRILRRIKKCLALAESANEHEAASALRQAKSLMNKYNISVTEALQDEIEIYDSSEGKQARSSYSRIEMQLISVVCEFFSCSLFSKNNWPVIAGVSPAPDICAYAIRVLIRQLRQGRKRFIAQQEQKLGGRIKPAYKRSINQAYSSAWTAECYEKIREFAQPLNESTQQAHRQAVERYFSSQLVEASRRKSALRIRSDIAMLAYQHGANDGKNAQLNHAMHGSRAAPLLLS